MAILMQLSILRQANNLNVLAWLLKNTTYVIQQSDKFVLENVKLVVVMSGNMMRGEQNAR